MSFKIDSSFPLPTPFACAYRIEASDGRMAAGCSREWLEESPGSTEAR